MNNKFFDAEEFILDNGLKLISIKRESQLMSIHAGIKVGPLLENDDENGVSHFVEHMLFKGTKKRNNNILNKELEQLGGDYNAYTDYGSTVYSVTALCDEIENSLDLLSDMLTNSIFPKDEIEKERGVILSEFRTSKDDIEEYSFDKISKIAFSKSPLKNDIIGNEKIIKSIDSLKLINFYKKYYVPNNCCITIVSSFEHKVILNYVKLYFNHWKCQQLNIKEIIEEKNKFECITSYKKDIEQSTITYLYTFYGLKKEEELALRILNYKLGSSSNSILFRKLREDRGLVYDVYSEIDTSNHVKTFCIFTSVYEEYVDETISIINESISDIICKTTIFDDSDLELMKKVLKTAVVSTIEDSTELGNYILHKSLEDEDINGFSWDIEKLKSLRLEDIYQVAQDVLRQPTIHILLPEKSE